LRYARLSLLALLILWVGCEPGCGQPDPDAGPDAGLDGGEGEGEGEGEPGDGGPGDDGGAVVIGECNENTPTFGDECGECGTVLCDPATDALFCNDPGLNDCGACGDIDESEGRAGERCGEFGCGVAVCDAEGTATQCVGDREPNACGGCFDLPPGRAPGEICSGCETGIETCTRDQNSLVCYRGREAANNGSCSRRILAHAFMDERLGGGFIRNGTTALFENINAQFSVDQLVFDPLVEGTGANGLVLAHLFVTPGPEINLIEPPNGTCISSFDCPVGFDCVTDLQAFCVEGQWMSTSFAADVINIPADPVRSYSLASIDFLTPDRFLILYDWFFEQTISVGQIIPGPPPGFVEELPDAGPGPDPDAGVQDAGAGDAG
jgi:hypothetical protein